MYPPGGILSSMRTKLTHVQSCEINFSKTIQNVELSQIVNKFYKNEGKLKGGLLVIIFLRCTM